jgi:hypothetical protein
MCLSNPFSLASTSDQTRGGRHNVEKKGESDGQSTRRRRTLRENEIKTATAVVKSYIDGLRMLNKSWERLLPARSYHRFSTVASVSFGDLWQPSDS